MSAGITLHVRPHCTQKKREDPAFSFPSLPRQRGIVPWHQSFRLPPHSGQSLGASGRSAPHRDASNICIPQDKMAALPGAIPPPPRAQRRGRSSLLAYGSKPSAATPLRAFSLHFPRGSRSLSPRDDLEIPLPRFPAFIPARNSFPVSPLPPVISGITIGSLKFPGNPSMPLPCSQTPVGSSRPCLFCGVQDAAHACLTTKAPTLIILSRLYHTASASAPYASCRHCWRLRNVRFRLVASLFRAGLFPAGFL